MYPVKTATAVTSRPAYTEGGAPGFFTAGNPVAGIPATVPGEHWFNMTQEELLNVIRAAGLIPSATDDTQLREAVLKLILAAVAGHNESGTAHADIRAALAGINIPAANETVAGVIKQSTAAQALAGTDDTTAMSPADVAAAIAGVVRGYTRQQHAMPVALGSISGAQAVDLDLHQELWMTAAGAIIISNPTNMISGKWCTLRIYAATAQTISWGSMWAGTSLVALPTAIDAGKTLHASFVCMNVSKMQLMGLVQGA